MERKERFVLFDTIESYQLMVKLSNLLPAKIVALAFLLTIFAIVIYKAIYIPITHDEKSASVYYAFMTVPQILDSDIWPSNHILNSLLVKLSESIFGVYPWSVRLPSVLAFCVLSIALWLIASRFFSANCFVFLTPFFLVLWNPFLIDFYSLARGYGMSNAWLLCSVLAVLLFSQKRSMKHYYLAILFSMLAAYANFTLLIYWVAVHVFLSVVSLLNLSETKRPFFTLAPQIFITLVLSVAFMALCYTPLYKMNSTNQFIYWEGGSFFANTISNTIDNLLYGETYWRTSPNRFAIGFLVYLYVTGFYLFTKLVRNRRQVFRDPLFVTYFLLVLVWVVNMLQVKLLGTPFLTSRTALSYFVLASLVIIFTLREVDSTFVWAKRSVIPAVLFVCVWHLSHRVNLTDVREWRYDRDTYKVMNYLKEYVKEHPEVKTVDLNTNWLYNPSFGFYCVAGITPWINLTEYHKEVDTASQTLFYYATHDDGWQLEKNYRSVLDFADNNGVLMQRR